MFNLPEDKLRLLLQYPFVTDYVSDGNNKISGNRKLFLSNLKVFESDLRAKGFTESDLEMVREAQTMTRSEIAALHMLNGYGFPVSKFPDAARLLSKNDRYVLDMLFATNDGARFFIYSLPEAIDFIDEENLPYLVKLAKATGDQALEVFPILRMFKGILNKKTWPRLIKIGKTTGKGARETFNALYSIHRVVGDDAFPDMVKIAGIYEENTPKLFNIIYHLPQLFNKKTWSDLVALAKAAKGDSNVFMCLSRIRDIIDENTWPDIMKLGKAAGPNAGSLFMALLRLKKVVGEDWPRLVNDLLKMAKIEPKMFIGLHSLSQSFIKSYDDFCFSRDKLIELCQFCQGCEEQYFSSFFSLQRLFRKFQRDLFDSFVKPVSKTQKAGAFLLFESCDRISSLEGGIQDQKDLDFIVSICAKYLTRANTILEDIILEGLDAGIMRPISSESKTINAFLEVAPAFLFYLYRRFCVLYTGEGGPEEDAKISKLFKGIAKIKQEIVAGELKTRCDEDIFLSVLYFVFACHDMTVPKETYIYTYERREDRQGDIPEKALLSLDVRLSKGAHKLKDDSNPVNKDAWDLLIRLAREMKSKREFNVAVFGFALLDSCIDKSLHGKREEFIRGIYQFSLNHGWKLPDFRTDYDVLMKYKEFVGDRIINDLIYGIMKASLDKDPQRFFAMQNSILGKKADFAGLSKTVFGVMSSPKPLNEKQQIISRILMQNGFHTENITDIMNSASPKDIEMKLTGLQPNIVEKGLTAKIFHLLYGDEYKMMQTEMDKFDFKKDGIGQGKEYTFVVSKRKAHCVAMFNMGVCVAVDDALWNSPDCWQLMIFDKDGDVHGGAIMRTIEENGKSYLILSIQPASTILNKVAPVQVFDKIVRFCTVIAKRLKYDNVLIPVSSAIHSNRGSIQQVIAQRFGKSTPLKLEKEYDFSYKPYHYSYQEFYIAY